MAIYFLFAGSCLPWMWFTMTSGQPISLSWWPYELVHGIVINNLLALIIFEVLELQWSCPNFRPSKVEFNCSLRCCCFISCRSIAGLAIWVVMVLYMLLGHGLGCCHTKLQLGKELNALHRIRCSKLYKSNCVPKLSLKVIMLMLAECCYHDTRIQCNDSEQLR